MINKAFYRVMNPLIGTSLWFQRFKSTVVMGGKHGGMQAAEVLEKEL